MVKERDVVRNKGGLDRETNLNRIAEQNLATLLDREIGMGWRRYRELDPHIADAIQAPLSPSIDAVSFVDPGLNPAPVRDDFDRSPSFDISF
jgi:hypothetical protein